MFVTKIKFKILSRLSDEFSNQTYPFVHMATHGEFSGMPEKTFLAAYNDGRITMDDLESMIRTGILRGSHYGISPPVPRRTLKSQIPAICPEKMY